MTTPGGQIHCQRCLAANGLGREHCARCGTRLMLVVEPSAVRYEDETTFTDGHDEHMLERVSALENRIARLSGKLEEALGLMLRQARASEADHALLESLVSILVETKAVSSSALETKRRGRCERDDEAQAAAARLEEVRARTLTRYHGAERGLLSQLVTEGCAAIQQGRERVGVRTLERAAAIAPDNAALNGYLGEHFYRRGKMALARDYLERALASEPADARVRLLLGLACADDGEASRAKELLRGSLRRAGGSYAAHYALGRLLAAEGEWKQALVEFKHALAARQCPEAHYVVALAYHQLNRHRIALRHLLKAVEVDAQYAEAFYLLGLVHLSLGERVRAAAAFDAAHSINEAEPRYVAARRRVMKSGKVPPPSLFSVAAGQKRRLVTGGDGRLAAALQADALKPAAAR
ncbi:MAG: tetratricopeptide repeat protein [Acidobacteriota bacterium]|nr:tetratricopeptide repeat protein [Acidobacteriota bacterium]